MISPVLDMPQMLFYKPAFGDFNVHFYTNLASFHPVLATTSLIGAISGT